MADFLAVGSLAPELALRADEDPHPGRYLARHPRVLAFVRAWSIDTEPDLDAVRRRLAALDAELVIVCAEGAWSFTRDGAPMFCDRLAGDLATVAATYGIRGDAVFVIDHRGVIRFAHKSDQPLGATLTDALDVAGEALDWREHHTRLERVQWSAREWALKCLVVGCALTFLAGAPAANEPELQSHTVERFRMARGTGPVRTLTRVAITPRTRVSAPVAQVHLAASDPLAPTPRRKS